MWPLVLSIIPQMNLLASRYRSVILLKLALVPRHATRRVFVKAVSSRRFVISPVLLSSTRERTRLESTRQTLSTQALHARVVFDMYNSYNLSRRDRCGRGNDDEMMIHVM